MTTLSVPSSFLKKPFYKEGDSLTLGDDRFSEERPPFYFDICHKVDPNQDVNWPWLTDEGVATAFQLWEEKSPQVEALFRERKSKQAAPTMIKLTEALICLLFWTEGRPVSLGDNWSDLESCAIAPVNLGERLTFICESPGHYHSFIQLTALFEEAKKKRALFKLKQKG